MSFPIGFAPADELNDNTSPVVSNTWAIVVVDKDGSPTDELVRLDRTGLGLCLEFPTPNSNFNATINCIHHVQTNISAVTATLPNFPVDGDIVAFADRTSTFDTNALTIDAGVNTIGNAGSTYVASNENETVWLQFDDTANDWNFIVFGAGGGGGGGLTVVNENGSFNAAAGNAYHWNSGFGAGTATLPASPDDGDIIAFVDQQASRFGESGFGQFTLTIDPNGNQLQNTVGNFELNKGGELLTIQYNDTAGEWYFLHYGRSGGMERLAPVRDVSGNFFCDSGSGSYAVDTNGGTAIGETSSAYDGAILIFHDASGTWGTNQFDLNPGFPQTINGSFATQTWDENYGYAIMQFDASNDNWNFISDSRGGGGVSFLASKETANFAGVVGTVHHVDTTGGQITATLPAGGDGDIILFADASGSDPNVPTGFGNNSLVINPAGGDTIQGFNSITLDVENEFIGIQYLAADNRWNVAFGLTSGSVLGSGGSASDPGFVTENGETLAADKVLLESDEEYQFLDPGGANRNVDLPTTPSYARRFVIIHDGGANSLDIRISAVVQDTITAGQQSAWLYSTSLAAWRQI